MDSILWVRSASGNVYDYFDKIHARSQKYTFVDEKHLIWRLIMLYFKTRKSAKKSKNVNSYITNGAPIEHQYDDIKMLQFFG